MRGKIKLWISLTLCVAAGTVMAAGLGPQSYAQDGLVTQFDVLDNEGTGTYNPSAATWRDLKGSAYITLQGKNGRAEFRGCNFDMDIYRLISVQGGKVKIDGGKKSGRYELVEKR